jgi:hypothetical protein
MRVLPRKKRQRRGRDRGEISSIGCHDSIHLPEDEFHICLLQYNSNAP